MKKALYCLVMLCGACPSVFCAAYAQPQTLSVVQGDVVFTATPPALNRLLEYKFLDQGNYLVLYARYGENLRNIDHGVGRLSYKGEVKWERRLVNKVFPSYVTIVDTESGLGILTVGDFFSRRNSASAIVLYDQYGSIVVDKRLCDVFTKNELDSLFKDTESRDVLGKHEVFLNPLRLRIEIDGIIKELPLIKAGAEQGADRYIDTLGNEDGKTTPPHE